MTVRRMLLALGVVAALTAAPANAGTYAVTGGCGNWDPVNEAPLRLTIYGECPALVVRHIGGPFSTALGAQAYWRFVAPPGATIYSINASGGLLGHYGWQAVLQTNTGVVLDSCPGWSCPSGGESYTMRSGPLGSTQLLLRVVCTANRCPNDKGLQGYADARDIVVYVRDTTVPAVSVTGGTLLSGWRRGTATLTLVASDNVGIKMDRLLVDGTPREQRVRSCRWGMKVPCSNGAATLTLDTTRVPDGRHTVVAQSVDAADNVGAQSRSILLDNTPPASPLDAAVDSGAQWRAANQFALVWRNPAETNAPIAAVRYELCPIAGPSGASRCVGGTRTGPDIHALDDLSVPRAGAWRARFWLVDAAGNADPRTAGETVLRFDDEAPAVVFREQSPADPARLRIAAHDGISGVARVDVEVRRRGEIAWTPLPTELSNDDYTAVIDDEQFAPGVYDLRAFAVDNAGNERSTTSRSNGFPAALELPVRRAAKLEVGQPTRRCMHRRCRSRLASSPRLEFGRRATLAGRLEVEGRPASAPVEVWQQVKLPGAAWQRVGSLRASRSGRFRFTIGRGPARVFRFRFAGSPTIRGATATVDARVRAASTFAVSRRDVVNGEYVMFRGRLKGRPIPAGGKLVELQVFTRRRWRTFAQPRASERTGRWAYQYRFETVSGNVRFRFRARIRREANYPYHLGTSREVAVRVHGI